MRQSDNTSSFMHETSKVSRTIGRDANVEVVFSGEGARTDGSTIYLPSLPADHTITNEQAGALRGYTDHETFHVRKTDIGTWRKAMEAAEGSEGYDQFLTWAQAIEDMRIERFGTAEYPGAKGHISTTVESLAAMNNEKLREKPELGKTLDSAGPLALTMEGRNRMGIATGATSETLGMIDPSVRSVVKELYDYVEKHLRDGREGTSDTLALARYMAEHGKAPPASKKPDELGGPGEAGDGKGKAKGEGEGSGDKGKSGRGEGGKAGGGRNAGPQADDLQTELSSVVEQAAHEVGSKKRKDGKAAQTIARPDLDNFYAPSNATGRGRYNHRKATYNAPETGTEDYQRSLDKSAGQISVMRRKLERMVQARAMRGWDRGLESGLLDPKRLTMAAMGVPTVWRRREDVPEIDTSVLLLIDLSGSMDGTKVALAQDVAVALSLCLNNINIDHAVVGFCNRGLASSEEPPKGTGYYDWYRIEPMVMPIFKEFGQPIRAARHSMGVIHSMAGGNNCDPCALRMAWDHKLRERQTKRRVLITISDGSPAWGAMGCHESQAYMKSIIGRIVKEGGECAGIGLLDDSVRHYYPVFTVANNLAEFAGKSMDVLARMLLGERVRVSAAA